MDLVLNSSGLVSVVETVALPMVWTFHIYELYSGVQGAGSWKKVSKSMTNLTSEVFQAEKLCTTEQAGPLHPWPPALCLEWDFQVSHWERLGSLSVEAQLWGPQCRWPGWSTGVWIYWALLTKACREKQPQAGLGGACLWDKTGGALWVRG